VKRKEKGGRKGRNWCPYFQANGCCGGLIRSQTTYVSPSDNIMSPCSKKLSDLKGKRFKKYARLIFRRARPFGGFGSGSLD
jgi:hypothetical protein